MSMHHETDKNPATEGSPQQSILQRELTPDEAATTLLGSPSFDQIRPALSALSQAEDYKAFTACVCTALTADDSFARMEAVRTAASINPSSEAVLWSLNALDSQHRQETNALQVLAEKFPEAAAPLARDFSLSGYPQERLEALQAVSQTMPRFARELSECLRDDSSPAVTRLAESILRQYPQQDTASVYATATLQPGILLYHAAITPEDRSAQQKAIVTLSQSKPHEAPLALSVLASAIKRSDNANTRVALAAFGKVEQATYQSKDLTRLLRNHHFPTS